MFNSGHSLDDEDVERSFDTRARREEQEQKEEAKKRRTRNRRMGTFFISTGLVVATALTLLAMRLAVLVVESYTFITSERAAEDEFVQLCKSGTARDSAHMRQACMHATVARASPVIVGAITRGVYAFLRELYVLIGLPFQTMSVVGCISLLGVLPWLETIRTAIFGARKTDSVATAPEHTIVVLNAGDRGPCFTAPRNRLVSSKSMLGTPSAFGNDDGFSDISLDTGKFKML